MSQIIRFLIGFFSGGVIAFSLAMLFAPQSGGDLRQCISNRTANLQGEIRKAAAQRREELQTQLETLRSGQGGFRYSNSINAPHSL